MNIYIKQYIKMAAQSIFLPAVYRLYRKNKVQKELILFADAHHASRPQNMTLLYEELVKRGARVEEMYLDYQKAPAGQVFLHMVRFMKRYPRASAVVICDNFLPAAACRKKKETRLIQLWHACGALKRFGYDTADDIPKNYRGHVFRGTDLVTVSSEACRAPFASAMKLPIANVKALGVSRTDRYFDPEYRSRCLEKLKRLHPEAEGKKIVLWAPTFRGNPGKAEVISLDLSKLSAALGEEYLVLASLHPHMKESGENLPLCRLSTEEMLPLTDLLIADYSSLIYEYVLVGKALVLYVPDFDNYAAKRGFYMDYSEIPGISVRKEEDLPQAIEKAMQSGMDPEKKALFLQKYMSACDGQATKRIADEIYKR